MTRLDIGWGSLRAIGADCVKKQATCMSAGQRISKCEPQTCTRFVPPRSLSLSEPTAIRTATNDFGLSGFERHYSLISLFCLVPGGGVEPPWPQGPADFESAASASSAIPAQGGGQVQVSHSNCAGCHCLNRALTVLPIKRLPPRESATVPIGEDHWRGHLSILGRAQCQRTAPAEHRLWMRLGIWRAGDLEGATRGENSPAFHTDQRDWQDNPMRQ